MKILVSMPIDESVQQRLFSALNKCSFLSATDEVDFVHVFRQDNFGYMTTPIIYPDEEQKIEIQKNLTQAFAKLTEDLNFEQKKFQIQFSETPKAQMIEYIKHSQPDLVIAFTKEKHGLKDYFASSFTEYLIKHSPVDVLVLRDK